MRYLVALVLLLSSSALAKHKDAYDHTGKLVYHAAQTHQSYLLEGRTDLFYDDNFYSGRAICTPGDDSHAPDCRAEEDWYVIITDRPASMTVSLDDGRPITYVNDTNGMGSWIRILCGINPCDDRYPSLLDPVLLLQNFYLHDRDASFEVRYRLTASGDVEIKVPTKMLNSFE